MKAMLMHAEKDQINTLGEVAKNVMSKNLVPPLSYKEALKKDRWVIRAIAEDSATLSSRVQTVVTKSKVISLLIRAVLPKLNAITK
ncbi:hypothetical protein HC928_08505 [bacterium]|nr:hypothetical protein [bacterium]